jgi:hypothetical protein
MKPIDLRLLPDLLAKLLLVFLMLAATVPAQQHFEVITTVDAPEIAGRPVQLDSSGKLLPWPPIPPEIPTPPIFSPSGQSFRINFSASACLTFIVASPSIQRRMK